MKTLMRRTSLALAMAYSTATIAQNPPVQQATGMIAGVLRDRDTKQPIEGAQVFVQGGAYGTTTKANGTYLILGVPVGTYTVVARIVGYSPVEVANVVVRGDVRRELNVDMRSLDVQPGFYAEPLMAPPRATLTPAAPTSCATGPGARFGVNGVQAASLSLRRIGNEMVFSFQSEPVVVEVESWSALKPGDVIQSINGEPITTRAGADNFSNPPAGADVVVAVRRNGERIEVVAPTCREGPAEAARGLSSRYPGGAGSTTSPTVAAGAIPSQAFGSAGAGTARSTTTSPVRVRGSAGGSVARASSGGGAAGIAGGGASGIAAVPAPARRVPTPANIVTDSLSEAVSLADFGLVLACTPICYRARDKAGSLHWRFIDPPVVRTVVLPAPLEMTEADRPVLAAVRRGRAAGLHDGVVIERVNGHAANSEEGSLLLSFPAANYPLNLDVRYSGRTQRITLRAPDSAR